MSMALGAGITTFVTGFSRVLLLAQPTKRNRPRATKTSMNFIDAVSERVICGRKKVKTVARSKIDQIRRGNRAKN
jgi:hypothetical protein